MPNGHDPKEYGGHKYADDDGTSDCSYGCGCWMGPARSDGPTGLDPFGKCPGNPVDGKPLGGSLDYDYVVTERIRNLESRLYRAEEQLKAVRPSKIELVAFLKSARSQLAEKNRLLEKVRELVKN